MRRELIVHQPVLGDTWWETAPIDVVVARSREMSREGIDSLIQEVGSKIVTIQAMLADRDRPEEWRRRATKAHAFTVGTLKALKSERHRRSGDLRDTRLAAARAKLDAGDVLGTLGAILDILDHKGSPS